LIFNIFLLHLGRNSIQFVLLLRENHPDLSSLHAKPPVLLALVLISLNYQSPFSKKTLKINRMSFLIVEENA